MANHLFVVEAGELDVFKDYHDGGGPKKVFHYVRPLFLVHVTGALV